MMWGTLGTVGRSVKNIRLNCISRVVVSNLKECNSIKHNIHDPKAFLAQAGLLTFSPRSIVEIIDQKRTPNIADFPLTRLPLISPRIILPLIEDNIPKTDLSLPPISDHEVHAVRLIVIRRKKMKNHKLRKLRKKMRSRWHQLKQRRRLRKEKAFRAELVAMVKTSEAFSAEQYVADKIAEANHTPLPKTWKGKRLPAFVIRQLVGLEPKVNFKHTDIYKA